jgi:hypothetical protein
MLNEVSPEREEYLIEQAAQYIVDHELEDFSQMVLEGTMPFGEIVGDLGFLMTYPLAVTFFARSGADFVNMFGFNYRVNAKKLIKRVEELREIKKVEKDKQKELEKIQEKPEGFFSRLISNLRRLINR